MDKDQFFDSILKLFSVRGFPPVELLFVLFLFGIALVPLLSVTNTKPTALSGDHGEASGSTKISVFGEIRISHQVPDLQIHVVGSDSPLVLDDSSDLSAGFTFESDAAGCDLQLTGTLPQGVEQVAIELLLEPDAIEAKTQTLWVQDPEFDEWLTFHFE